MDFKDYQSLAVAKINEQLEKLLQDYSSDIGGISQSLQPLIKFFIKGTKGGKRVRGIFIKLGYELAGGGISDEIIKIAAAYEIFHTAILAHDDVIDQSPTRRGQPSLYKSLGGAHHGISQAICLGDCGFFLATKIIAESNFPAKLKVAALEYFSKAMLDTAIGEMLDVELPYLGSERFEKDVHTIMKLKTARYTVSTPLQLGAVLSGEAQGLVKILGQFGENLGIAFQIQDDILGVFGLEEIMGKSVTSDIEEGKNTILIIEALKKSTREQKKVLKKYYGKGTLTQAGLKAVRKVFLETKALDYAKKEVIKYTTRASNLIPRITNSPEKSKLLQQMIEYLIQRSK